MNIIRCFRKENLCFTGCKPGRNSIFWETSPWPDGVIIYSWRLMIASSALRSRLRHLSLRANAIPSGAISLAVFKCQRYRIPGQNFTSPVPQFYCHPSDCTLLPFHLHTAGKNIPQYRFPALCLSKPRHHCNQSSSSPEKPRLHT